MSYRLKKIFKSQRLFLVLCALHSALCALHSEPAGELTVNVENTKVKIFLGNVIYNAKSFSSVSYYAYNLQPADERPAPAVIALPDSAVANTVVRLQNTASAEDCYEARAAVGDTAVAVYNLIPQQRYAYKAVVERENGDSLLAEGFVNTKGALRMIYQPNVHNCRDLGGKTTDRGTLLYGLIFRGSQINYPLDSIEAAAIAEMRRLGVKAEIDMRDIEAPQRSIFGEEVPYLFLNIKDVWNYYFPTNSAAMKRAYEFVVNNLRQRNPVYAHCIYGADRTGVLMALIEASVGVKTEEVIKDYELSSFSTFVGLREKKELDARLLKYIGYTGDDDLKECARRVLTQQLGVSAQDIDDLTDILHGTYDYEKEVTCLKEVQSAERRVQSNSAQPNSALCTLHSALNIAGQRVNSGYKGLVIKNGKKISR